MERDKTAGPRVYSVCGGGESTREFMYDKRFGRKGREGRGIMYDKRLGRKGRGIMYDKRLGKEGRGVMLVKRPGRVTLNFVDQGNNVRHSGHQGQILVSATFL